MLEHVRQQIETCNSLEDLRETWARHAKEWRQLPRDEAEEIIKLKDKRKAEIGRGLYRINMDSKVLDRVVKVEMDVHKPERAVVDGVEYTNKEMRDIISRGLSPERLREIHRVKRSFGGKTLTMEQAAALGGEYELNDNKQIQG